MSRFMQGLDQATRAIMEALTVVGFNDASEFVRKEFYEKLDSERIEWTLREVFGTSPSELQKKYKDRTAPSKK